MDPVKTPGPIFGLYYIFIDVSFWIRYCVALLSHPVCCVCSSQLFLQKDHHVWSAHLLFNTLQWPPSAVRIQTELALHDCSCSVIPQLVM